MIAYDALHALHSLGTGSAEDARVGARISRQRWQAVTRRWRHAPLRPSHIRDVLPWDKNWTECALDAVLTFANSVRANNFFLLSSRSACSTSFGSSVEFSETDVGRVNERAGDGDVPDDEGVAIGEGVYAP